MRYAYSAAVPILGTIVLKKDTAPEMRYLR